MCTTYLVHGTIHDKEYFNKYTNTFYYVFTITPFFYPFVYIKTPLTRHYHVLIDIGMVFFPTYWRLLKLVIHRGTMQYMVDYETETITRAITR